MEFSSHDSALFEHHKQDVSSNKLISFLLGTIQPQSKLKLLRGQTDILRMIWVYACSEWWTLHLQKYSYPVIRGLHHAIVTPTSDDPLDVDRLVDLRDYESFEKTSFMDCPAAIVATSLKFPSIYNEDDPVYVNMMPFDLWNPELTLPHYLQGYIKLIKQCQKYQKPPDSKKQHKISHEEDHIAYLTVDERPITKIGEPQRRGGVHVESPGALRNKEIADKSCYAPEISFYHHWGMGNIDGEYVYGGIYIASNMANTTAIWNSRVHDTFGDIIGPHGSLERCRDMLGPPSKLLEAGELVWISDRTPHESLPIHTTTPTRQFFRLVVGTISFWFTDHNTPNPKYTLPPSVTVIEGNKFHRTKHLPIITWECGNDKELRMARKAANFRAWLYSENLGFLADELIAHGIMTPKKLLHQTQYSFFMDRIEKLHITRYAVYFIMRKLHDLTDPFFDEDEETEEEVQDKEEEGKEGIA